MTRSDKVFLWTGEDPRLHPALQCAQRPWEYKDPATILCSLIIKATGSYTIEPIPEWKKQLFRLRESMNS